MIEVANSTLLYALLSHREKDQRETAHTECKGHLFDRHPT